MFLTLKKVRVDLSASNLKKLIIAQIRIIMNLCLKFENIKEVNVNLRHNENEKKKICFNEKSDLQNCIKFKNLEKML